MAGCVRNVLRFWQSDGDAHMNSVRPEIKCYVSVAELVDAAAFFIAERVTKYIEEKGRCRLALAGGSTPRPVYVRLARDDLANSVPWQHVHVFWGDERCVPPSDEESNYYMAWSTLLSHVPVVDSNVHRIEAERGSIEAARAYSKALGDEALDLVLLGMGADGHTASLFPDSADLDTGDRVVAAYGHVPPFDRVSISLRQINEAREVHLLVSGSDKAERLAEVWRQIENGAAILPAARVQPHSRRLFWLLDTPAAQNLGIPKL